MTHPTHIYAYCRSFINQTRVARIAYEVHDWNSVTIDKKAIAEAMQQLQTGSTTLILIPGGKLND